MKDSTVEHSTFNTGAEYFFLETFMGYYQDKNLHNVGISFIQFN